jgi:hypothetical protein
MRRSPQACLPLNPGKGLPPSALLLSEGISAFVTLLMGLPLMLK